MIADSGASGLFTVLSLHNTYLVLGACCGRTWSRSIVSIYRSIYSIDSRIIGGRRWAARGDRDIVTVFVAPCELHVGWWRWVTDSDRWGQGSGDIVLTNTRNRARWAGLALARFWYFCTIKNPSAA